MTSTTITVNIDILPNYDTSNNDSTKKPSYRIKTMFSVSISMSSDRHFPGYFRGIAMEYEGISYSLSFRSNIVQTDDPFRL